jgi:HSP20 family molecular chaperone IbpA
MEKENHNHSNLLKQNCKTMEKENHNHSNLIPKPSYKMLEKELRLLKKRIHTPKVDLIEFPKTYEVTIELPGLLKENLNVELKENHIILISGTKNFVLNKDAKVIYQECNHADFTRRIKLPGFVKTDIVSGTFEHGILTLVFSKLDLEDNSCVKQIKF